MFVSHQYRFATALDFFFHYQAKLYKIVHRKRWSAKIPVRIVTSVIMSIASHFGDTRGHNFLTILPLNRLSIVIFASFNFGNPSRTTWWPWLQCSNANFPAWNCRWVKFSFYGTFSVVLQRLSMKFSSVYFNRQLVARDIVSCFFLFI